MLFKILLGCFFATSLFGTEQVYLRTPVIEKQDIIGTNVGIRPFRKTGVRIEAESLGDKLVIHNYGYGSAGLTLSFGGALEVTNILNHLEVPSKVVAILGIGVAGLTTAYDLLAQGYTVHIYADKRSPHLTSNVAAGIWTPLAFPKDLSEEKKELHLRLERNAKSRFLKSVGDFPEFAGVRMMTSYGFTTATSKVPEKFKEREEIVVYFDNGVIKKGRRTCEIGIDGQLFMEDLCEKVKKKGAIVKECHFASLEDVMRLEEPIIINCTSMGSMHLFNDQEFIPVRGQIVYLKPQKEIDYVYAHTIDNPPDDPNIFFVALSHWSDRLILGGVYELGQSEPEIHQEVIEKLIENAKKCLSGEI